VPDLSTLASATRLDTLRTVYGAGIARELLPLEHRSAALALDVRGYVSNANYSVKKLTFLLFINRTTCVRERAKVHPLRGAGTGAGPRCRH
jgi:hypothetical protein